MPAQNEAPSTPASLAELTALRARVEQLEAREARRRRWFLGLVAATLVMSPLALAADGTCPGGTNGMPFCFAANNPALATQVNHNFAQLKEWLELKVGAAGANVTIATPTTINNTLTTSGTVTARGLSVTTNSTLAGNLTVSGTTALGVTNAGSLNVANAATIGGDLVANNNTTGACFDTAPACNMTACPSGYFMIGLDILENEACGGGGDFDFSQFVIRCCQL